MNPRRGRFVVFFPPRRTLQSRAMPPRVGHGGEYCEREKSRLIRLIAIIIIIIITR